MEKRNTAPDKQALFEAFSSRVIRVTGSSTAFIIAIAFILVWACTGPLFHYSDTWQLIVNTSTTIVTFLMVFLIQKAQNKDSKSIQLKLNELINAVKPANNGLIGAEDLTESELDTMHQYYTLLAERTRRLRVEPGSPDPLEKDIEKMKAAIDRKEDATEDIAEAAQDLEAGLQGNKHDV